MSKIKRQSGIELLRIIAMIQIIFLHAYTYGFLHDASKAAGDIVGIFGTFGLLCALVALVVVAIKMFMVIMQNPC